MSASYVHLEHEKMKCEEMKYKKVVFKDGSQDKVARGSVEFEKDFVKVTDRNNKTIYINKSHVVFVKDIGRD